MIIEIDGIHHFKNKIKHYGDHNETRKRDVLKMKLAVEHNYILLRFFQEDIFFDRIDWQGEIDKYVGLENIKPSVYYICKNNQLYDKHKSDLQSVSL